MDLWNWIFALALIYPILFLVRLVMVAKSLASLRFGKEQLHVLPPDQSPPHLREAAAPLLSRLEGNGFRFVSFTRVASPLGSDFDLCSYLLLHSNEPIAAWVRPYIDAARLGMAYASFQSTLQDGTELATTPVEAPRIFPPPAAVQLEYVETDPLSLLNRHRQRLAEAISGGATAIQHDGQSILERNRALMDDSFELVRQSPDAALRPDGCYGLRFAALFRHALRFLSDAKKQMKAARKAQMYIPQVPSISEESQTEFELESHRRTKALERTPFSLGVKSLMTAGSLLVFAGILAWQFSFAAAITLLVALVFHEGGHLAGMKLFGFRDTQLLFFPFFGGAAVGLDDRLLPPIKHLIIIFLGPLPGIFVVLTALALLDAPPAWLHQGLITALILNAFNLLPFMPMDGGQVVDFAFITRFPRARVFFLSLSGLALVGLGLWADGLGLLAVLGAFMLMGVPSEWRKAALIASLRREHSYSNDHDTLMRRILPALRRGAWLKLQPAQRLATASSLKHTLGLPLPGWGTLLFALACYFSPLWLGLPLYSGLGTIKASRSVAAAEQRAQQAGLLDRPRRAALPLDERNAATIILKVEEMAKKIEDSANAGCLYQAARKQRQAPEILEMVALLRGASRCPVFRYPELRAVSDISPVSMYCLQWLGAEASEAHRNRQPDLALELAGDGLRLGRLFTQDPRWWSWNPNLDAENDLLTTVEEVLSSGHKPKAAMLEELFSLLGEGQYVTYAREALALQSEQLRNFYRGRVDMPGLNSFNAWRMLFWISNHLRRARHAEYERGLDESIQSDKALQAAERGDWNAFRAHEARDDSWFLQRVPMHVARLRQARAALIIHAQAAASGRFPKGFAEIVSPLWKGVPEHPLTGDRLEWIKLGGGEALRFPNGKNVFGEGEFLWRLPLSEVRE